MKGDASRGWRGGGTLLPTNVTFKRVVCGNVFLILVGEIIKKVFFFFLT